MTKKRNPKVKFVMLHTRRYNIYTYLINSFTAGLFLYYFSFLVNALIVLNDISIQYRNIVSSFYTFRKLYKTLTTNEQTNECRPSRP